MGNVRIQLFDTIAINPKSMDNIDRIQDNVILGGSTGASLYVDVIATHAGRPTRNNGFYLPQKMRVGAASMTDGYEKPVLVHHNAREDPIGRIVEAVYIDTSNAFTRDSTISKVIKDLCNPKTSFIQSVNLVDRLLDNSELMQDPSFPGLGHIRSTFKITNKDAQEKILDGRYLTVSTGVSTNKAVCSICKSDWAADGIPCEHTPGKEYDGKICLLIAGNLLYDEASFVNVPADSLAGVITIYNNSDHTSVEVKQQNDDTKMNANFYFNKSALIGGKNMDKAKEAWEQINALNKNEVEYKTGLEDFLKEHGESEFADQAKADLEKLTKIPEDTKTQDNALHVAIEKEDMEMIELLIKNGADVNKKNNWGEAPLTLAVGRGNQEITKFLLSKGADVNAKDSQNTTELSEDEKFYTDSINFALEIGLITEDEIKDAKLTEDMRKNLPKSMFCKDRTYVANDSLHVKVAMAYAKKSEESEYVLNRIAAKAKSLGCKFGKESTDEFSEDAFKAFIDTAIKSTKDGNPDTEPEADTDTCDSCDSLKATRDNLKSQLSVLRQEYQDVAVEFSEMRDAYTQQLSKTKDALCDAYVNAEVVSGKEVANIDERKQEVAIMPLEDMLTGLDTLKKDINIELVGNKINDGTVNVPEGTVENPTLLDVTSDSDGENQYDKYKKVYYKLMNDKGIEQADSYLNSIKAHGIVPTDFEPK
jgi:hypothetical protein